MKLEKCFLLAIVCLSTIVLGACHSKPDPLSVRFRYWGDTEEITIVEARLKEFEAAHPGVHIHAERKSADSTYVDVLLQEFAAGTAPDIIFISTDHMAPLAASGQLTDLGPFMAKEPELKTADFYPELIRHFSVDGKLYLLPRDIAPISCIYYDKELFDAAKLPYPKDDWTWDDLRADALRLTHRGAGGATQIGFADDWNLEEAWVLASGGQWLDDDSHPSRFTFADEPALDGLLFRYKLMQVDRVMPSSSDNQALNGGAMAQFMNGQLAMFHSGYWKTPAFKKIQSFHWDIARFPRKPGAQARYYSGGSGYAMRSGVTDPQLCWQIITFMAGPDGQAKLAATGLTQPALRKVAESPAFLDGQAPANKKMLLYCAEHAQASPNWLHWLEFQRSVLGPETDAMWIKGFSGDPAALIKTAQDKANAKYFPQAAH